MESDHHHHTSLYEAMLKLESPEEVEAFLKDLCTPQELRSLCERWDVCQFLNEGKLSYRQISRITNSSTTTIGRVSRFLNSEPYQGYKKLLEKIEREKKNVEENNDNRRSDM